MRTRSERPIPASRPLTPTPRHSTLDRPSAQRRAIGSAVPFVLLVLVVLLALAAVSAPAARAQGVESATAFAPIDPSSLDGFERRVIVGDVVEYSFQVPVGPGPHDVIGLHRVVREVAPFVPLCTAEAVFLVHGDAWGFDAAFLAGEAHSLPVFLAENNVDVWGIDLRWTQLGTQAPVDPADLAVLADWGFGTDVEDLGVGLAVARGVRFATGSGRAKMTLVGWSRGGQLGYAHLSGESRLPRPLRQVGAFVPVDVFFKSDDLAQRAAACTRADLARGALAAGQSANTSGVLLATLHQLSQTDPSGLSPVLPWLTNRQAELFVGTATFAFSPPGLAIQPVYHFAGGPMDFSTGLPVPSGLFHTDEDVFFRFVGGAAPYQPNRQLAEADAIVCAQEDLPWDDHLASVTVPVLYLGAPGGFGALGVYSTTLLASTDVSVHIPSLLPPEQVLFDLGHADIFLARDAESLYWRPLLEWLGTH